MLFFAVLLITAGKENIIKAVNVSTEHFIFRSHPAKYVEAAWTEANKKICMTKKTSAKAAAEKCVTKRFTNKEGHGILQIAKEII